MVALNLDKETRRILCAYEIPSGHYANGTVLVDTLPNGILYEYRYVDGEYIHDPLSNKENLEDSKVATLSIEQDDTAIKISELENKIDKLQKMVDSLSNKS